MRAIGGFLLTAGIAIAGLWVVQLTTGQVPEVTQGRVDIWFHIVAELATAGMLVAAGVSLLGDRRAGRSLGAIAVGALAYTTINSPGYYAEAGDWLTVGIFAILAAVTISAGISLVRSSSRDETTDAGSSST